MMNESAIMPFETMGYDTYIYAAIGDSKTCDICAAMDGEQFLIKDRNPGTNFPPMHANCRCSFEIAIEGDDSLTEREESHKGVIRDTEISRKYIDSAEYRKKFDTLGEEEQIIRSAYQEAKKMLKHRSGTNLEDMTFINSKTNELLTQKTYKIAHEVIPTLAMKKMANKADDYTIIAMHNHNGNSLPSKSDIATAKDKKYKYGLAVCHNGDIYKYTVKGDADTDEADFLLELLYKALYNNNRKEVEKTIGRLRKAGVNLEIL